MSFTSLDLDGGSPVTMLVSRPSGSPLASPPNSPLSQSFGVDPQTGAYFDPYPDVGETGTLGYDGSRGVFFLITSHAALEPHLMTVRRAERAQDRPTPPAIDPRRVVDVRRGQRDRRSRAQARETIITLNVADGIKARDQREDRQPETLLVDHASRAQRAAGRPVAERAAISAVPAAAASQDRRGTPTTIDQTAQHRAQQARIRSRQPGTLDQHELIAAQHARQPLTWRNP